MIEKMLAKASATTSSASAADTRHRAAARAAATWRWYNSPNARSSPARVLANKASSGHADIAVADVLERAMVPPTCWPSYGPTVVVGLQAAAKIVQIAQRARWRHT